MNSDVKMEDIKRLINKIQEKEEEKATIEKDITELKLRLADIFLNSVEDSKDNTVVFVGIRFNGNGKIYDYIWNGGEVNVGDFVMVESRWGGMQEVEVVSVRREPNVPDDMEYKYAYPLEA